MFFSAKVSSSASPMRAMMLFRIGNAPTRNARRRKFSCCIDNLDTLRHPDVKSKNHHQFAGPHTAGNDLSRALQMREADLSVSPRSQVTARALLPLDRMDRR